jgi:hypothetical protein
MNITDGMVLKYQVLQPYPGDISGFREDSRMIIKKPLDGSDLSFGSNWAIAKIKNDKITFHALNAPSIWSRRVYHMADIRLSFNPLR